jgi:broad specificity phosphatase PhoE
MTQEEGGRNTFAIRHGETAWSLSGQHTGTTDLPLTENGRRLAERMRPVLAKETFALVLVCPMQRARETCRLAGLGDKAVVDPDLVEWNYGEYEGLTPTQIHVIAPGWLIFRDGCPGGEARAALSPGYGYLERAQRLPRDTRCTDLEWPPCRLAGSRRSRRKNGTARGSLAITWRPSLASSLSTVWAQSG